MPDTTDRELKIMYDHNPGPCSIQFLKEKMLDRQFDVSRLIARLHSKLLVRRTVSAEDRRKTDVYLTRKGIIVFK